MTWVYVVAALPLVAYAAYTALWWLFRTRGRSGFYAGEAPGPARVPVMGNTLDILPRIETLYAWWEEQIAAHGHTVSTRVFNPVRFPLCGEALWTTIDPRNVEYILKTNFDNFVKGPNIVDVFSDFLGRGIFVVNGDEWRSQRKMASHMFKTRTLKTNMMRCFVAHAHVLVAVLRAARDARCTLDLQEVTSELTLDAFIELAFSRRLNALESWSERHLPAAQHARVVEAARAAHASADAAAPGSLGHLQRETHFSVPNHEMAVHFQRANVLSDERFFDLIWLIARELPTPFPQLSRLLPRERRLTESLNIVRRWVSETLDARVDVAAAERADAAGDDDGDDAKNTANFEQATDLINFFCAFCRANKRRVSRDDLRDVQMSFMLAGRDTTGQLLTWVVYYLWLPENADVLARARAEVRDVFGGDERLRAMPVDAYNELYDAVQQLRYCRRVLDETLRLRPPVPFDPKTAVHDDTLPSGHRIEAGSDVMWSAWCAGRSPAFWHEPERFRPERFLDPQRHNGGIDISPWVFVPFQAGPRLCLGMNMAYTEALTVLARLLLADDLAFALAPDADLTIQVNATLLLKHGMRTRVLAAAADKTDK